MLLNLTTSLDMSAHCKRSQRTFLLNLTEVIYLAKSKLRHCQITFLINIRKLHGGNGDTEEETLEENLRFMVIISLSTWTIFRP